MGGRESYLYDLHHSSAVRIQFKKGVHILHRNKEHYETNHGHLAHQKRGGVTKALFVSAFQLAFQLKSKRHKQTAKRKKTGF
jgi:hypothetical protein